MKVRLLATGLVGWLVAYAWVYIEIVRSQGSAPRWWYLAIIGAGGVPSLLAVGSLRSRPVLIGGAVILGVAAVLALPSIGLLLAPGVFAGLATAMLCPRRA